jgi:hypothetical protein
LPTKNTKHWLVPIPPSHSQASDPLQGRIVCQRAAESHLGIGSLVEERLLASGRELGGSVCMLPIIMIISKWPMNMNA